MSLKATYFSHTLNFTFAAGTSRGVLHQHQVYYLKLWDTQKVETYGLGEAAPLKGLSIDYGKGFEKDVQNLCQKLQGSSYPQSPEEILDWVPSQVDARLPALRFALETALLDLVQGGKKIIFPNDFRQGRQSIPINGLVWMGDFSTMKKRIREKLDQGFTCLKLKIGALNFSEELALLDEIRANFSPQEITLRVDANGAFSLENALDKLSALAQRDLHSIEQPIAPGQSQAMAQLCQESPLAIALDEELIGISDWKQAENLLKTIRPPYIILKPTLLGGMAATKRWIELAESLQIQWWITSALESNIGLNAISQFTAQWKPSLPQGLGTGGLYDNNIDSPLSIHKGHIYYDTQKSWNWELEN